MSFQRCMSRQSTNVTATPVPGPAGPADPVQVGLLVFGALVVDHVRDVVDVDARARPRRWRPARRPCRSGTRAARAPAAPWPRSPCTAAAAKPRVGSAPATWSPAAWSGRKPWSGRGPRPAAPGPAPRSCPGGGCGTRDARCRGVLWLVVLLGADVRRPVQVAPGQGDDLGRHGGGEQHCLPLAGDEPQDPLDVGQEAEVEHPVRLVEHERAHAGQVEVTLAGQVSSLPGVPTTTSTPA